MSVEPGQTADEILRQLGAIQEGIAALQALDDLGPEANAKATRDEIELWRRMKILADRLSEGGYHFFVGGEWHRTETKGEPGGRPVECTCGISNQDSRVLKHRGSDDESWKWVPATQLGACFPQHMREVCDPSKRRQA